MILPSIKRTKMRNYLPRATHLVLFISFLCFSPEISDARAFRGFSSHGMEGGLPTATGSMGNFRSFGSSFGSNNNFRHGGQNTMVSPMAGSSYPSGSSMVGSMPTATGSMGNFRSFGSSFRSNNNFRHGGQNTMMSPIAGSNYPSGSSMLGARNSFSSRQGGVHNFGGSVNGNRQFSSTTTGMRGPQFNTMNTGSSANLQFETNQLGHTNVRGPVLKPSNLVGTGINTMNPGLGINYHTNVGSRVLRPSSLAGTGINTMNPGIGRNYHTNIGSQVQSRPSNLAGTGINTMNPDLRTNHHTNIGGRVQSRSSNLIGAGVNTMNPSFRPNYQFATNQHGLTDIKEPLSTRSNFGGSLNRMNSDSSKISRNVGSRVGLPQDSIIKCRYRRSAGSDAPDWVGCYDANPKKGNGGWYIGGKGNQYHVHKFTANSGHVTLPGGTFSFGQSQQSAQNSRQQLKNALKSLKNYQYQLNPNYKKGSTKPGEQKYLKVGGLPNYEKLKRAIQYELARYSAA